MKFKVGDKVRIVANSSCHGFDVGETIEIYDISSSGNGYSAVDMDGDEWWFKDVEAELAEPSTPDEPTKQPHYNKDESSDVIAFCAANNLDFLQGNIIKYVCRFREKNGLEDLEKAEDYLRRLKLEYEKSSNN